MKLVPIDLSPDAPRFLYDLLSDRPHYVNISHKRMPTFLEHTSFVRDHPYAAWYLIEVDGENVGMIYLTKRDEIGIQIRSEHQRKGYGSAAIRALIDKHGERKYLANVAPANEPSKAMFRKLGFEHVQDTLSIP